MMGIMMPETCWVNLKWINVFTSVIRWFFLLLLYLHWWCTVKHKSSSHWYICPVLACVYEFQHGRSQTVAFASVHEQPFPLSHYCGISNFLSIALATQTAFQLVLFEECLITCEEFDFYHDRILKSCKDGTNACWEITWTKCCLSRISEVQLPL